MKKILTIVYLHNNRMLMNIRDLTEFILGERKPDDMTAIKHDIEYLLQEDGVIARYYREKHPEMHQEFMAFIDDIFEQYRYFVPKDEEIIANEANIGELLENILKFGFAFNSFCTSFADHLDEIEEFPKEVTELIKANAENEQTFFQFHMVYRLILVIYTELNEINKMIRSGAQELEVNFSINTATIKIEMLWALLNSYQGNNDAIVDFYAAVKEFYHILNKSRSNTKEENEELERTFNAFYLKYQDVGNELMRIRRESHKAIVDTIKKED